MNILTIIGARPQFIKASMVSRALKKKNVTEVLCHTGQHYDDNMSHVFFKEMQIPAPKYNLGVGSCTHAEQTASSLRGIEEAILIEKPDLVLVYGDTNATIAGALAASKLHIPIAHIEAGLRSYNRTMPEEVNRVLTDMISSFLFCPTKIAVKNLEKEGITKGVFLSGDVMVDALNHFTEIAEDRSIILDKLKIIPQSYGLMTIHRPANADNKDKLSELLTSLKQSPIPIVFPIHPRTLKSLKEYDLNNHATIRPIDPVGYLDMMWLEKNAKIILTDSGGIQKEAYLHKVPCLTIRPETEWVETVEDGWNTLVDNRIKELPELIQSPPNPHQWRLHYGDGNASEKITQTLLDINE